METTTLHLRGIPATLAERLFRLAQEDRRSLNQEAIVLLERAVTEAERERQPLT